MISVGLKKIPGFSNYYISKEGKVWSNKRKRYLATWKSTTGYFEVGLCQNGKLENICISVLLLTTFVRLPKAGEVARHLNDIPIDDDLDNLAWGTHKENSQDMCRNGHHHCVVGEKNPMSVLFPLDVINIHTLSKKQYKGYKIAEMYNVSHSRISEILHGKAWKYIFKVVYS